MYQVIHRASGLVVGTYSTLKRARNKANKLDLAYGAIGYHVKRIEEASK